ncbi:hypothetical protein CONPUDRAFT_139697 [Coniophora puteana RWD-64-598 SS2]|uniref:Up-regulated during septation protein 1 domain-containing protein n=1 Tax=Coniophora puteana (strain RWD-64-598) TaxID=741705 RepID=A0A5M3MB60_CONPW|nr:uncharacterized protein CONPUDRAFT_139697 [Coniophora puteana RWD-64-598 SS2]EIW76297.1 hypothetical protein CONPUDRAFT_139697 [Coniophora puteana RWD-64-598 SS2]
MLSTRLLAMQKKLSLETKIRDAALNLSRVNAPHKTVSRQTEEQVAAAERKVDEAQKELWRVADRANDVQRRLLEHRAGVLGYTVSKMERTMAPPQLPPHLPFDDDYAANGIGSGGPSTPSRALSPGASSVASATSATTHSSAARFDGAHLFAGHAQAQLPRAPPSVVEVLALEARLRKATDALADANRRQAESARELAHLRLEKAQVEATMSMELQSAEENAAALETELRPRLEGLLAEREAWEADRARLEEREEEVERLEGRLEALEERSGESVESTRVLETALEEARAERDAAQQRAEGLEREVERARQEKDEQQIAQTPYEGPPMEYTGDSAALVAQLQPLWDALPAPEARMSKFRAQRHLRGPSGASSANASSAPPSPAPGKATTLSDNDVRSLRTLYDTAGVPGASKAGFSVEALVGRVQALVADDRALIDRLIRSAQAHEMLKRNAERAQKLAEDGNAALQMYQDQVNELEDENMRLVARGDELSTEIRHLRDTLDQARATSSIGAPAVNGNGNDAGGATAAVEAAERAKAAAEAQLRRTEEELDSVRAAQGQLQMSLMNEMTDLQTENDNLRAQLRARK